MQEGSFDGLATPLHEVTFCVVDIETTGGSPAACGITEIGAARFRGGERLGTFQTLVNPGLPIPPVITVVTGITEAMVLPAPRVDEVLPSLLEFVGGSVLVGHNLRFDTAFLDAALVRAGWQPLRQLRVDTVALARRLVLDDPDEVADCRLSTLAARFGLGHTPCHRALDDALATADLLHLLLERAAGYHAFALDDLLALPRVARHPQAAKLRMTARLPRAPGVYVFRDRVGRALRVGRAANLRRRVRSYFAGNGRGPVGSLLREAQSVDHVVCRSSLESAVLEVRLLHALEPRHNRAGTGWRSYRYVTVTGGRTPRLAVARTPRPTALATLGPVPSTTTARALIAAIDLAATLGSAPEPDLATNPDPAAGLEPAATAGTEPAAGPDVAAGPASAAGSEVVGLVARRGAVASPEASAGPEALARALAGEPGVLLAPLAARADALARGQRYAQATAVRDQASALARALRRQRQFDVLRRAGRIVVELPGGRWVELLRGRFVRAWDPGDQCPPAGLDAPPTGAGHPGDIGRWLAPGAVEGPPADGPVPLEAADEMAYVAAWLDRHANRLRLIYAEGEFTLPLPGPAGRRGGGAAGRVYAGPPCSLRS